MNDLRAEQSALLSLCRNRFGLEISATVFVTFYGLSLKGQLSLRNDADALAISVDHDTPNLMFLHCLLAAIQILSIPAGHRILPHIFLTRRAL